MGFNLIFYLFKYMFYNNKDMTQQMKHLKTSLETTDDGNEDNRQQTQLFAKNSMDRFGDDLCALLVSYISLEDRFRLECVSKQFQRTVFGSVVDITLSDEFIIYLMSGTLINTQLLATIARKFTNIGSIDCREITYGFYGKISHMLKTFRDNCRHLREIYATIWQMHSQWMHPFESLVTTISYTQREPNLRYSLTTYWSQLVKNLHTIELNDYSAQNNRLLAAFAAQNQSIRSVVFYSFERPIESTLVAFDISRLPALQTLVVEFPTDGYNFNDNALNAVLSSSLKLKTIEIRVNNEKKFYSK
ncbi:unnamed protein product, partial [Medioppia subpectinata]